MTREELIEKAKELRTQGETYREIDTVLGMPTGKAWALVNHDKHRQNSKESEERYIKRGRVAFCDMED